MRANFSQFANNQANFSQAKFELLSKSRRIEFLRKNSALAFQLPLPQNVVASNIRNTLHMEVVWKTLNFDLSSDDRMQELPYITAWILLLKFSLSHHPFIHFI